MKASASGGTLAVDTLAADPLVLDSVITCPHCGHAACERMPTDACQWAYECHGCGAMLTPLPGDCCVYCSYGSVPCPPVQASGRGACCN